jgi:hypothetical protein
VDDRNQTSNQADQSRDVLMGQSLRERAHELRRQACTAWSDVVVPPYAGLDEAKGDLARALEDRLRGVIDELADLACPPVETRDGLPLSQESKYTVAGGRLVNRATGVAIPDDEPVFVLRAKDRNAAMALDAYMHLCVIPEHREAVRSRVEDFLHYARLHMTNLKEPDTAPPRQTRAKP